MESEKPVGLKALKESTHKYTEGQQLPFGYNELGSDMKETTAKLQKLVDANKSSKKIHYGTLKQKNPLKMPCVLSIMTSIFNMRG